jgi:hypothetical protein
VLHYCTWSLLCSGYSVLQELTRALELKLEEKKPVGQLEQDGSARSWMTSGRQERKDCGNTEEIRDFSYVDPYRTETTLDETEENGDRYQKFIAAVA